MSVPIRGRNLSSVRNVTNGKLHICFFFFTIKFVDSLTWFFLVELTEKRVPLSWFFCLEILPFLRLVNRPEFLKAFNLEKKKHHCLNDASRFFMTADLPGTITWRRTWDCTRVRSRITVITATVNSYKWQICVDIYVYTRVRGHTRVSCVRPNLAIRISWRRICWSTKVKSRSSASSVRCVSEGGITWCITSVERNRRGRT